ETPIVDVQSVKRQMNLNGEVVDRIPTSRGYGGIVVLMPSIINGGADVQTGPANPVFGGAGGRGNEGRVSVDGGNVGASLNGAGTSGYLVDVQNTTEVGSTN